MKLYAIVGAGGFGREVMPVAVETLRRDEATRDAEIVFVANEGDGTTINGHRVMTPERFLATDAELHFNIAIADYKIRERVADQFIAGRAQPFSIRGDNVVSLSSNKIGEGSILCHFSMVTSNATIGRFFHGNIYSYVTHDCVIGDFVTFAPNVHCNGGVVIEDYAYIGTGAVLRQGTPSKPLIIGKGAVVGMGAVVTKNVEPFTTVIGNPAAPMKSK